MIELPAVGVMDGARYDWELKDRIQFGLLYSYDTPLEHLEAEQQSLPSSRLGDWALGVIQSRRELIAGKV